MCLVDPALEPQACSTFEASIHILLQPLKLVIKLLSMRVSCDKPQHSLVKLTSGKKVKTTGPANEAANDCLRTGDRALARFRFVLRPELLHAGTTFIFREGSTKGIGHVVRTSWSTEEMLAMIEEEEATPKSNLYLKHKKHEIDIDTVDDEEHADQSNDPSNEYSNQSNHQSINQSNHRHAAHMYSLANVYMCNRSSIISFIQSDTT